MPICNSQLYFYKTILTFNRCVLVGHVRHNSGGGQSQGLVETGGQELKTTVILILNSKAILFELTMKESPKKEPLKENTWLIFKSI